ncbi:MAG: hypothetical protein LQ344_001299 [Seirophora lacunosa]|nr:MAG: hypothetical protein LQ344_001299 [Seirophora lacunosa]
MERVNRSTDEVMHGVILGDTDDRNNDACQVNHSLNKENLTAHGMIVEHIYGFESPEARTRAFVDHLDVALADIAGAAPSPPAQDPEISPPKIFPPPNTGKPAPEPAKPRVMARGSPEKDLAEIFLVPSPATPISDPVKRQEATGGSPGCHRRAIRRVAGLADINGRSEEESVGERASPSLGRCQLCLH